MGLKGNDEFPLTESEYTQIPKLTSRKFVNIDSKFLFA
jgi:hypothetical protein